MKSIYSNCSGKILAKNVSCDRIVSTISLTLLCLCSPLFAIATSAQIPDNENVELQQAAVDISNVVSTLIAVLQSENIEARVNAARALGGMGTQAKTAEPALTVALYDKEPRVRYSAAIAIANLGADTKDAFPELLKALKDESKWTRLDAAYALNNVVLNLQAKAGEMSVEDLNKSISEFEQTLKVMADAKLEIPEQIVKSIDDSLDSLRREKQRK